MSETTYPIATLADMAAIPDEALPRFVAELPSILTSLRQMCEAAESIAEQTRWPWYLNWLPLPVKADLIRKSIFGSSGVSWTDDDKGTATLRVHMREDSEELFNATHRYASLSGKDAPL